jgi:hypothetical protein
VKIKASVRDGTPEQKQKIIECIARIQAVGPTQGINLERFLKLPWKIGFVSGTKYENGYPHTRMNVIILNQDHMGMSSDSLCRLLIHEQTHVYQKTYPHEIHEYLSSLNLRASPRVENIWIPTNPDINEYRYEGYGAFYKSVPQHFGDIHYVDGSEKEHPLEEMAYRFEKSL